MANLADAWVGKVVQNRQNGESYCLLNFLGNGGFATVYKAKVLSQEGQDNFVAIKIIEKRLIYQKRMEARVQEEVTVHNELKHPSILEMFSYFDDANYWYLVLELATHGELQKYLQRQYKSRLEETEAVHVFEQIVDGMLYLHQRGVMHRDLSLSNLLMVECRTCNVTPHLHVKIADFGLASQLRQPNEEHMTLCGTPNYMSPEVAARTPHGLSADVWGLGCILYTLLVGQPPFETKVVKETLTRVVACDYQLPDFLSYEAKDLIRRLLQREATSRISLQDISSHPFMLKGKGLKFNMTGSSGGNGSMKFNSTNGSGKGRFNTVASNDSGNMTGSSSSRNYSPRPFYQNQFVTAPQRPTSDYSSYYTPPPPPQPCLSNIQEENDKENFSRRTPIPAMPIHTSTPLYEKLDVPPLNTIRLNSTSHTTKDVTLSIQENGEVEINYTRRRLQFRVSCDGAKIFVREYDRETMFTYQSLPAKHFKRYKNAHGFVEMVKAKTPKVTYYSAYTKFQLMETLEDFEAFFFNGTKITQTVLAGTQAFDAAGAPIQMPAEEWSHFQECQQHCLTLEKTLSQMPSTGANFPVSVGRRPMNLPSSLRPFSSCQTNSSTPLVTTLEAFSTPQNSRHNAPQPNAGYRTADVPGIGSIVQYNHNGIIQLTFQDGSKIVMRDLTTSGFSYVDFAGYETSYTSKDLIPSHIREKLQKFYDACNHLNRAPLRPMR